MQRKSFSVLMAFIMAMFVFTTSAITPARATGLNGYGWIKDLGFVVHDNLLGLQFTTSPGYIPMGTWTITYQGKTITTESGHISEGNSECNQDQCYWFLFFGPVGVVPNCVTFEVAIAQDLGLAPAPSTGTAKWSTPCPLLGSIRGTAFEDKNANGKWDAGELSLGGMWFKVTGGGDWYVCGHVGDDSTYGVTVNPGTYYVLPSAPKGYRTTTPRITAEVTQRDDGIWVSLNNDIGFVKDDKAPGDGCDQYNPAR